MLTCLVCSGPLEEVGGSLVHDFKCPTCGYWYPADVLSSADPDDWAHVQREKLACTKCEGSGGMPRVHMLHGRPVSHRRRYRWSRWWRALASR